MARRLLGGLVLGSALAFAACGGEGLTLPPEGEAAHIEVISGSDQGGRVGSLLEDSLVVKVTDVRGRVVEGATVGITFPEAGGEASPDTVTTDANGIAWSYLTLGTTVGTITGTVAVAVDPGFTPVQATFTLIARSDDADSIAVISGDEQSAPAGTLLPAPLVVQVIDEFGNPISGVTVSWSVEGGGSVSEASTVTGANGQTSVSRTLGPTAGQQSTLAAVEGLAGSPVTFTHTATAGSATRVGIVSGDDQTGAPGAELPQPLVVEVLDESNNPVVDLAVEWVVAQGGGTANPTSSRTDGQGRASTRWTLGSAPGNNTLNAVVSGVGRAEFTAVGERIESSVSITSDTPDPSLVGQAVQVAVTVSGEGGTPTGSVTVAGESAAASCSITLAGGSGSCEIVFTQPGSRQITASYSGDGRFEGDTDTESHQVNAANNPPTAAFTPPSCTATQPCQFTDGSSDSDGQVVSWDWSFGDGGTSDDRNPMHAYATPGTKQVTLTVTDDDGATNSVTHSVTVAGPPGNQAPIAVPDNYSTPANTPLVRGFADGVLANDSDPDDDRLSLRAEKRSDPTNGVLRSFDPNGSFDYFPNQGATSDSFTYQVFDPDNAASNIVTVTITITQ